MPIIHSREELYERYVFQCRIFFSQEFICMLFSCRNQSAGHFFLKSPITSSKVKWSAPKINQTFGSVDRFWFSIISNGFWNNRGQNSLGERGGIRFYLPLPGKSVPTYGDVRCLGWIVYQILLPMVLRYNNYTLAVKFYILSGISRLF